MPAEAEEYPVYYFTSDTSGEKAFEEFFIEGETCDFDRFSGLGVIKNSAAVSIAEVRQMCTDFRAAFAGNEVTKPDIVQLIRHYVPNFQHLETGKNLDQKM